MIYWMNGDEMWKTTVDENVHLVVPAFGIDCTGVDDCWAVRLGLSGGVLMPLDWVNTFDTFSMVDGTLTCYMKSYARDNTKLQQLGVWNATFSADGKVDYMSQDVLYTSFLPGGYNVNDDMGASQYIHGPRGFNAMMFAWETGDEASFKAIVDDNIQFTVEDMSINVVGAGYVWQLRQSWTENNDNSQCKYCDESAPKLAPSWRESVVTLTFCALL